MPTPMARPAEAEDKRGGYSGSANAADVPPPARIPSGSVPPPPTGTDAK